jgi:hypothetical protein
MTFLCKGHTRSINGGIHLSTNGSIIICQFGPALYVFVMLSHNQGTFWAFVAVIQWHPQRRPS